MTETAAAPRRWVVWLWAAQRVVWSVLLPGAWCLLMLLVAYITLRTSSALTGAVGAVMWVGALGVLWFPAREIWRVCSGARVPPESELLFELRLILGAAVLGAALCAIVAPSFVGLMRFSGDGSMKGDLRMLRAGVQSYKKAHGGQPPPSLEAMQADGTIAYMPRLWPHFTKASHPRGSATEVVSSTAPTDSGRWAYVVSASSPALTGAVFINCTHTDARGSAWYSY